MYRMAIATSLMWILSGIGSVTSAGIIATDQASNYANWSNGSNQGTGFGAWSFSNGGTSGFFLQDSTTLSGGNSGGNINSSGSSFGMYGGVGGFANADRSFGGNLNVGDVFSIYLAVNFRNGNKGFNLYAGATEIFNFNVGSNDYRVNNAATNNGSIGNSYSNDTVFELVFNQTSMSGGTWTVNRSGGILDSDNGTYSGIASRFQLYVNGTDGGSSNDFFSNSMSINAVPEPSSGSLVVLFGLIAGARRRRTET